MRTDVLTPAGRIDAPSKSATIPAREFGTSWSLHIQGASKAVRAAYVKHQAKWLGLIIPAAILIAWQVLTTYEWIKPVFLPGPGKVASSFVEMLLEERLAYDFWTSASVVTEGFVIGTALGLGGGFAAGLSKATEGLFGPFLDAIRQVPALAWLPLIVLWAGAGTTGKVIIITKTVFFPVFMNTLQGIRAVPRDYIEVARIFNYSRARLLRRVVLPAATPSIFVGLRFGAGLAWAFIIAAEMLGGRYGLGVLLTRSQELLLTDHVFVVIVIIGLVGFAVDSLFQLAQRRILRWKHGFEG